MATILERERMVTEAQRVRALKDISVPEDPSNIMELLKTVRQDATDGS